MVVGVVLAAGRSSRMGRPKWRLFQPFTGSTFASHLVVTGLEGGLDTMLVVGGPDDGALPEEVARLGAGFVVNPAADEGQLSSIVAGLDVADRLGAAAVMVMPVDVPLISAATVAALLATMAQRDGAIFRATHQARHGHPVLFTRAVFAELRAADPAQGARAVVRADPARVVDVEVPDEGVTIDIDTPEDYRRAFGRDL